MAKRTAVKSLAIGIICFDMVMAACRSGTQTTESWTHDDDQHATSAPTAKSGEIKDPIVGVLVAASIDSGGHVANPKFSFDATEPRITVIVQVGKITNGDLDLVWYQVSDSGDQKLFEHHVPVASYERAYSIGKNPGLFASGRYKVVATLAGQTKTIEFFVKQLTAPKKTSAIPASTENVRLSLTDKTPWSLASSTYRTVAAHIGRATTPPLDLIREAPPAAGASPASPQQGNPPVDGGSGKTPPAFPNAPPSSGCNVDLDDNVGAEVEERADIVTVSLNITCSGETHHGYGVQATVEGPPRDLGILIPGTGTTRTFIWANPCELPGGKDLPGTKVRFEEFFEKKSSLVVTLGDDTSPPHLDVTSTPSKGAKVKPGDKIALKIKANEVRSGESWQTGVMAIQVTADPGGLVTSKDYLQHRGKSCDAKSWQQSLDATYTVPADPPPIFQLCAIAEDFAGNKDSKCAEFRTGNTWKGKLHLVSSVDYGAAGSCSNETWDGDFYAIVRGAEVKGKGRAHSVGIPQCHLPFNRQCEGEGTQASVDVKGTFDGKQFQLLFPATAIYGASMCGLANYTFFLEPGFAGSTRSPSNFTVPVIAPGDAEAQLSNTVSLTVGTAKGQLTISMLCQDCK